MRFYFPNRLLILDVGLEMDIYSKFGIYLICILALVLLAVTPGTATPDDMTSSLSGLAPASLLHHQQNNHKRSFASGVISGAVHNRSS